MSAVCGRSLSGHLRVVAAVDERRGTFIRDQSVRAPLHLSKPHRSAGALVVNIVSSTTALMEGDEVEVSARVEQGASLVLTTPSACRIHRAGNGAEAVMRQEISVATQGFGEFFPELLIPQGGARYRQSTTLHVEPGGTLVFFEWLAPGRVASRETFGYTELLWDTDVWFGGTLVARERYTLRPDGPHLASLRALHPASHYLGCFVLGDVDIPHAPLDDLAGESVVIGAGPLIAGGWTIKALCGDNLTARRTLLGLRSLIYEALARPMPDLRRV